MKYNSQLIILCAFWFPAIILLSVRIYLNWYHEAVDPPPSVLEGYVLNYPREKDGFQLFRLKGYQIKTSLYPKIFFGDFIRITNFKILKHDTIYFPNVKIMRRHATFGHIRRGIVLRMQKDFPEPYASLILGILVGYKEDYPKSTQDAIKRAGVMHVMVVSGYNISLVLGSVFMIFKRFNRLLLLAMSFLFTLFYVFLVGFDPPVLRASLMGAVGLIALINGKQQLAVYTLFICVTFLLFVNPDYLSNVSFQLSSLATLAIIGYSSLHVKQNPVVQTALVTLFVNLALIPLLLHNFGQYSLAGIVVNLLVLWTIPFLTLGGFLYVVLPMFILKLPLLILSNYFFFVTNLFGKCETFLINGNISINDAVIYYVCLLSIYRLLFNFVTYYKNAKA